MRPIFITLAGQARPHGNAIPPETFIRRVETPMLHLMPAGSPLPKGTVLLFPGRRLRIPGGRARRHGHGRLSQ